jgi:hypothetical protein
LIVFSGRLVIFSQGSKRGLELFCRGDFGIKT